MVEIARSTSRARTFRRPLGAVAAVAAVAAAVAWGLGVWNPWQLVVFSGYFGQPGVGLVVVATLSVLAARLLTPVVNEVRHVWRARVQVIGVITGVIGLIVWNLTAAVFSPGRTVIARSPGDDRAVVWVEYSPGRAELRVWAGRGLSRRDVGWLGRACGQVTARFLDRDRVEIDSAYGTFRFRLDPATGEPLETLGEHCSGDR